MSWIYTFLYVLCNPPDNSLSSCPKSIRSYTFRATLSQFYEIGIRSDTFYHVPYTPLIIFEWFCKKLIRSYTFRATLSQLCETGIRSDTFWTRSVTFLHAKWKKNQKMTRSVMFCATVSRNRSSQKVSATLEPFSLQRLIRHTHIHIWLCWLILAYDEYALIVYWSSTVMIPGISQQSKFIASAWSVEMGQTMLS